MPKKKSDAAVASEIEVKKTFPLLYQETGSHLAYEMASRNYICNYNFLSL